MARWSKPSKTGKSRLATSWHVRGTFELWLLSCFRVGSSVGKSQHFIVSEKLQQPRLRLNCMRLHDIHIYIYMPMSTHVRISSHEQGPKLMSVDAHRDNTKSLRYIKWFYFMETMKIQCVSCYQLLISQCL